MLRQRSHTLYLTVCTSKRSQKLCLCPVLPYVPPLLYTISNANTTHTSANDLHSSIPRFLCQSLLQFTHTMKMARCGYRNTPLVMRYFHMNRPRKPSSKMSLQGPQQKTPQSRWLATDIDLGVRTTQHHGQFCDLSPGLILCLQTARVKYDAQDAFGVCCWAFVPPFWAWNEISKTGGVDLGWRRGEDKADYCDRRGWVGCKVW